MAGTADADGGTGSESSRPVATVTTLLAETGVRVAVVPQAQLVLLVSPD